VAPRSFDTSVRGWEDIVIPFSALAPIYRTKSMQVTAASALRQAFRA
jgi:hypothetical protein